MNQNGFSAACVIDNRVSTDRQALGSGLENQFETCQYKVRKENWQVLKVYSKSYSGAAEEREDFEIILKDIKELQKNGIKVDYYVFSSIDRLTRLGSEAYAQMKRRILALGVQPIDTRGVIQPMRNTLEHLGLEYEWSVYSPTEAAELHEAVKSKGERRDILTRVVASEALMTRQGYNMRQPLDGYQNTKILVDGKLRTAQERNPERCQFFIDIFNMRASGQYSDKQIVAHVNSLGYLSRQQKRWGEDAAGEPIIVGLRKRHPLTVKQLQRIVKRIQYAGVRQEQWNGQKAVWNVMANGSKPITDIKTFNAANRGAVFIKVDKDGNPVVLYDYDLQKPNIRRRKKFHPDYLYDKLIVCDHCRKPLKNSGKGNRGKSGRYYQAYHCDRSPACKKAVGRIPKKTVEDAVTDYLARLKFSKQFAARIEKKLIGELRKKERNAVQDAIKQGETVNQLRAEQDTLLRRLDTTTSQVVREKTEAEIEALERQIIGATEERDKSEISERDIKAFVKEARELVEHPAKALADNRNPYRQQAYFELVFTRPPAYLEIVSGTPKIQPIFRLSKSLCGGNGLLVSQLRREWNKIEESIISWKLFKGHSLNVAKPNPKRDERHRYPN